MAKSARRAQIENAALYPLEWVEERTGLVGGMKFFLFRHVPRDINWMQTLGAATLTAFLVDRKSTRLNSSHLRLSRMPSSA